MILGLCGQDLGPGHPCPMHRAAALHKGHPVLAAPNQEWRPASQPHLSRKGGAVHQQVQQDHKHEGQGQLCPCIFDPTAH